MKKIFTFIAWTAFVAFSHAAIVEGTCGDNLTWSLNTKDSTLTIKGCGVMTSHPWFEYHSYIAYISLQEGIEGFEASAFQGCENIKNIVIPNSIKSLSYRLFYNCENLVSVSLGNGVTYIGEGAFFNCKSLSKIHLPIGLTALGQDVFYNCKKLTSINIPYTLTKIGKRAFLDCPISTIYFNGTLEQWFNKKWNAYACFGLYTLVIDDEIISKITIPNSIARIDANVFYNCKSLTSVTMHDNVNYIGPNSFYKCPITRLYVFAQNPPNGGASSGIEKSDCTLYVPKESIEIYSNTIWWEDFKNIRTIGSYYIVKFVDWDGTVLSSDEVEEGSTATPPADPARQGYTFTGWDKNFSNVQSDLTVTAQYTQILAIDEIFVDSDALQKILLNGQLYILRGDKTYTITGVEVK